MPGAGQVIHKEADMTAIIVGVLVIVTAGILYPFWPDTAPLGPFWSSVVMCGMGFFAILLGAWWKLSEG